MIGEEVKRILADLPKGVTLVGAAKTRTPEEVLEAVEAGLEIVGHNYVQEAEQAHGVLGRRVKWHMIGHLQSNKAKKAARIFDMIETVDSMKLAQALDRACQEIGKCLPVLIEINSGEEPQKAGIMPVETLALVREMASLEHIKVMGLMTMGPFEGDPEDSRPYFRKTRKVFEQIKAEHIPGVDMKFLSMGMSNSYKVAMEEGANLIRIGTAIFGERSCVRA